MTTPARFQEPWLSIERRNSEGTYDGRSSVMYNNYSEFGIIRVAIQILAWSIIVHLPLSKGVA